MSGRSPSFMTGSRAAGRAGRAKALSVAIAVTLLALLLPAHAQAASPAAAPASASPWVHSSGVGGFGVWTNGVVLLVFPTHSPSLSISAVADPRVGTTLRIAGLAEVNATGYFAAFAPFEDNNTIWQLSSSMSAGTLDLTFTTTSPVVSAQGDWEAGDDGSPVSVLGNATFRVNVYLNDSAPSTTNSARISVNATGWPWVNNSDALGLDLAMIAAKDTRIASSVGPTNYLLQELSNATNASVASLLWAPAATVLYGNGATSSSPVTTFSATSSTGANSTVHLLFGSVAGNYSSLSYDPWIALNLGAFQVPPLPAWALDLGGWVTLAVAAGVLVVLAFATTRRRRATEDDL